MSERSHKASDDAPRACATGRVRLYVPDDLSAGRAVALATDQAHYVRNVMRRTVGDVVYLFNGRDGEWRARLVEVAKRAVVAEAKAQTRPQDRVPDLTLGFAPLKRGPQAVLVEKAVELGVAVLQPVLTRRTQGGRINMARIEAEAREAAEQCGRLTVPDCLPPLGLDDWLGGLSARTRLLFCDEAGGEDGAPPALSALLAEPRGSEPWAVLIGPEGGFAAEERDRLLAHPGALRVSLGPRIMRAETAAMAALALWQAVLGDLG